MVLTTEGPHPAQHKPAMTRAHQGSPGQVCPITRKHAGLPCGEGSGLSIPGLSTVWQGQISPGRQRAQPHSCPCTAPGQRGTTCCPTATRDIPTAPWLRGLSPLPYFPWFAGDIPAAPHPMDQWRHPCCPRCHDLVGHSHYLTSRVLVETFLLQYIPWLEGDVRVA